MSEQTKIYIVNLDEDEGTETAEAAANLFSQADESAPTGRPLFDRFRIRPLKSERRLMRKAERARKAEREARAPKQMEFAI